jgi:hypothetical protein
VGGRRRKKKWSGSVGLLQLHDGQRVLVWIDDPGHEREADVRDPVDRLQPRHVVLLDLDAARTQLGELSGQVVDPPGGLSLLVGRARGALRDRELALPTALVGDRVLALVQDLEAELAGVELLRRLEIGGQKDPR